MRSFWSDPYLWVHLAGIAAVPIFLEICLLGFAVGDPLLPVWLELFLVGAVGIGPLFWMQWQRPFYIFSLLAVSLKPEQLTEDQRRLLTLFKSQRNRLAAAIVPILLFILLQKTYAVSAIAASVTPFPANWRLVGLFVAAIGFLACNLFTQVPISVLGVVLHSDAAFAATPPYPLEQIRRGFSVYGLRVNRILPPLVASPPVAVIAVPTGVSVESGTISDTETLPVVETADSVAALVEVQTDPVAASASSPSDAATAVPVDGAIADSPEPPTETTDDEVW